MRRTMLRAPKPSQRRATIARALSARLDAVQRLIARRPELRRDSVRR